MKRVLDLMKQSGNVGIMAAFLFAFNVAFAQDPEIKTAQQLLNKDKKKQALETLKKAAATYPDVCNYLLSPWQSTVIEWRSGRCKGIF
ncbi:MAG: hypothetical protein QM734_06610 [Cyclobacteriaceae bacterium]